MVASTVRTQNVRAGVQIEAVSILWMVVEAVVAIGAGVLARSVLLTSFGFDSVIEVVSAGALLYRLSYEERGHSAERVAHVEHRVTWITGIGLSLLCVYVVATSVLSLLARGSRNSGTPFAIASTPVKALQPEANAFRIRRTPRTSTE